MKQILHLHVNGEEQEVLAPIHHTLLEVLREELDLTGTKHGCELGECGACTVLVDGLPTLSCLTLPIEVQGTAITTVEGLRARPSTVVSAGRARRWVTACRPCPVPPPRSGGKEPR